MPRAIWNSTVIAEAGSDEIVELEGNIYFPPGAVKDEYLEKTDHTSVCAWKGQASYYTITVDGRQNVNAAWTYDDPNPDAAKIKGHIAFWNGVTVEAG